MTRNKATTENETLKRGFAALVTVIMLAAGVLIVAFSASIMGLGELNQGYISQKGGFAFTFADGCMEETYRRIKLDSNYGIGSGDITLTHGTSSCIINVTDTGSDTRRIDVDAVVESVFNKKLQSSISITASTIVITDWKEISE